MMILAVHQRDPHTGLSKPPGRLQSTKTAAEFHSIRVSGIIAWLAWLFVHLIFLVGFRNRFVVAIQWGFQYLTFNRGARLITGKQEISLADKGPKKV